jgi:hypothetical protein
MKLLNIICFLCLNVYIFSRRRSTFTKNKSKGFGVVEHLYKNENENEIEFTELSVEKIISEEPVVKKGKIISIKHVVKKTLIVKTTAGDETLIPAESINNCFRAGTTIYIHAIPSYVLLRFELLNDQAKTPDYLNTICDEHIRPSKVLDVASKTTDGATIVSALSLISYKDDWMFFFYKDDDSDYRFNYIETKKSECYAREDKTDELAVVDELYNFVLLQFKRSLLNFDDLCDENKLTKDTVKFERVAKLAIFDRYVDDDDARKYIETGDGEIAIFGDDQDENGEVVETNNRKKRKNRHY